MNKRKILEVFVIGLIIVFTAVAFLIISYKGIDMNELYVSIEEWEEIKTDRMENGMINGELKINGGEAFYDKGMDRWIYSIVESDKNGYNPKMLWRGAKVALLGDNISDDLIENNRAIKMLVYDDSRFDEYELIVTTLPVIEITTSRNIDDEDIAFGFRIFDNRANVGKRNIESSGSIHVRGASSSVYPKKSYKFTLISNGEKVKMPLLGMRSDDDWVLYAGYNDQEKIRNVFSTNLWMDMSATNNRFGVSNGSEYRYVELIINSEYQGLYALGYRQDEKSLQLNKNKSGNYDEYMYFKFTSNEDMLPIQMFTFMNSNSDGGHKAVIKRYLSVIDSECLICINDIMDMPNNVDYRLFIDFTQAVDSRLQNRFTIFKRNNDDWFVLYSPWDLDQTFGNKWNGIREQNFTTPYIIAADVNYDDGSPTVKRLMELGDSSIEAIIKDRYMELRNTYLSRANLNNLIDQYENWIYNSGAFIRDMNRWPDGTYGNVNDKLNRFRERVDHRIVSMDEEFSVSL